MLFVIEQLLLFVQNPPEIGYALRAAWLTKVLMCPLNDFGFVLRQQSVRFSAPEWFDCPLFPDVEPSRRHRRIFGASLLRSSIIILSILSDCAELSIEKGKEHKHPCSFFKRQLPQYADYQGREPTGRRCRQPFLASGERDLQESHRMPQYGDHNLANHFDRQTVYR